MKSLVLIHNIASQDSSEGVVILLPTFLSALVAQVSIPLTESWYGNVLRDSDGDVSSKEVETAIYYGFCSMSSSFPMLQRSVGCCFSQG